MESTRHSFLFIVLGIPSTACLMADMCIRPKCIYSYVIRIRKQRISCIVLHNKNNQEFLDFPDEIPMKNGKKSICLKFIRFLRKRLHEL